MTDPAPSPPVRPSLLRRFGPWVVAAAALAWVAHVVPVHDLRAKLAGVWLPGYVALVVAYVLATLAADSVATWLTFRHALPDVPISYLETLQIRGASYLLAILNYGVGQGGTAYFLHRRRGVPLARAAGAVLLTAGVNVVIVAACAAAGVALGGLPTSPAWRLLVLGLAAGFPAYLVVIALRPGFLARRELLRPLFDAGLRGHAVVCAARLPHMAVLITGHYAAMRYFGVAPAVGTAIALLPILFAVSVLPISPSGFGTPQAVALELFAHGASADRQAAVAAYSLSLAFIGLAVQAIIGVLCLRIATRRGTVGAPDLRRARTDRSE